MCNDDCMSLKYPTHCVGYFRLIVIMLNQPDLSYKGKYADMDHFPNILIQGEESIMNCLGINMD